MGCSCQHFDCWSTTCADFLNTTNCCANTPHSYNTLPQFFLESFSQTWKHSACSFLYTFASQPYGYETTALIWTVYQWVVATEPGSSMRGGGDRGADQVPCLLGEPVTSYKEKIAMACCKEEGLVRQLFLQMNWITSRFVGIIYQPKKTIKQKCKCDAKPNQMWKIDAGNNQYL